MDTLNVWIKHVILLVLFATFLELLIPSNSYKKFIKVIMGLLILLAVLQPVLDIMQKQWEETSTIEVTARNIVDNNAETLNNSMGIQSEHDQIALAHYRKELAKQIQVLAGSVDGIADIKAEVVLNEMKGEKNYGMIKNVTIFAKAGYVDNAGTVVKSVERVEVVPAIPGLQENAVLDKQRQTQIKRIVAEFYHLKTEQIIVKEWQGK